MIGTALFVLVAWALLRWPTLRAGIGASGPGDARIAPFLLFLASALGLLASPLAAALSRHWERQADAFSLELTHDPETFESTHRRLALSNLADLARPRLIYLAWLSHPTPSERIAAARARRQRATRLVSSRRPDSNRGPFPYEGGPRSSPHAGFRIAMRISTLSRMAASCRVLHWRATLVRPQSWTTPAEAKGSITRSMPHRGSAG
jgi:hypothetical protein